jgi:hypothetical protein
VTRLTFALIIAAYALAGATGYVLWVDAVVFGLVVYIGGLLAYRELRG